MRSDSVVALRSYLLAALGVTLPGASGCSAGGKTTAVADAGAYRVSITIPAEAAIAAEHSEDEEEPA